MILWIVLTDRCILLHKTSCGSSVGAAICLGPPSFQPESLQGVGTRGAGPEEVSGGRSRRGTIMTRSSSLLLGAVGPLLLCSPPSLLLTLPSLAASISRTPPLPSSRQYLWCLGLSSYLTDECSFFPLALMFRKLWLLHRFLLQSLFCCSWSVRSSSFFAFMSL